MAKRMGFETMDTEAACRTYNILAGEGRPVGALLLCASANADYTVVHGRVVVKEGQLSSVDLPPLVEQHNRYAQQLARRV